MIQLCIFIMMHISDSGCIVPVGLQLDLYIHMENRSGARHLMPGVSMMKTPTKSESWKYSGNACIIHYVQCMYRGYLEN